MAIGTGKRRKVKKAPKKTSRTRKPDGMALEEWQRALRREYGRDQDFQYKNVGDDRVFSEFAVTNPDNGRTYRVAIRGREPGMNYCSCPDFAVNTLGTCKHVEWLIAKLERRYGVRKAFAQGNPSGYSEVYLEYGAQRRVRFRAGTECPAAVRKLAGRFFDAGGLLKADTYDSFDSLVHDMRASGTDVRIYDDAIEFVARLRDDDARARAVVKKFEGKSGSAALDKLLKVKLYPYQKQ